MVKKVEGQSARYGETKGQPMVVGAGTVAKALKETPENLVQAAAPVAMAGIY